MQRDRADRLYLESYTSQHFLAGRPPANGVVNSLSLGTNPLGGSRWTTHCRCLLPFCIRGGTKYVVRTGTFCVFFPHLTGLGSPQHVQMLIGSKGIAIVNTR